jgi:hypothetical protein
MAKYLIQANYVGDGIKGLLKEGGSSRRDAVEKLVGAVGGFLLCLWRDRSVCYRGLAGQRHRGWAFPASEFRRHGYHTDYGAVDAGRSGCSGKD